MKAAVDHYEFLIKHLKDPEEATAYLNAALEAGDKKAFLLALRNVLEARGGMTYFARRTKLNRVSLYKILSRKGNPELGSLVLLLSAIGIRLQVTPKKSQAHPKP